MGDLHTIHHCKHHHCKFTTFLSAPSTTNPCIFESIPRSLFQSPACFVRYYSTLLSKTYWVCCQKLKLVFQEVFIAGYKVWQKQENGNFITTGCASYVGRSRHILAYLEKHYSIYNLSSHNKTQYSVGSTQLYDSDIWQWW